MGASVADETGKQCDVHMGSYGIGVSRLVGGIIEASHDEKGIIWPQSVAPFDAVVVNLKPGNDDCDKVSEQIYNQLMNAGYDVLMDDSSDSPGAKLNAMDLIGCPFQIIIGPRGMKDGIVEFKIRKSGESQNLSPDAAFNTILEQLGGKSAL
jgi:prolyl-tRNA synthetase